MVRERFECPCAVMVAVCALAASAAAEVEVSSATFGGLEARAIGPAATSGRIAAIDVISGDRTTIYIGAAGGGLWKSVNGGTTFKPVCDDYTQSIGAIRVDRANTDTVWVGTGESWTRNSVSVGTGVYKTTDGGENWTHVGLADTERISKILVHPTASNVVYVCATGHLWNANEERGVFKTTDAGKTWERILYIGADTGCGDIAIDPQQPDILYAGMWQFRRYPYFFHSGGPGSGLYKTTDGGKRWCKLTNGLPEGELGRIAVAVAPSRPSTVYAVVESENTGMYRSDDLGETWRYTGTNSNVEGRPFYFAQVHVDPTDFNRVYKPGSMTAVSTDGGETFSTIGMDTHADHHAFWIDPGNPDRLMVGTDGGLYTSNDRGVTWSFVKALPIAQFYTISVDMEDPYNVYGGLQDNGSWMAPSRSPGGIQNKNWDNVGMGDGFHVYVDRADSDILYVEWQGGRIQRARKSTGESKNIQPLPRAGEPKLRFNWNTPIHLSENRADTLYIGAQFLLRSRDRGESWARISEDLTTDDPTKQKQLDSGGLTPDNSTAENHCTIYSIDESPVDERVIWVGTDDGNLQVTRDSGTSWTNVVDNVPGLPAHTWVTHVEAGRHRAGEAFVTFDGHRTGDMSTYVYKTDNFGETFTPLHGDDIEGYALCILQDLVKENLLFLGTEFGLYISLDGGINWARFKENLPKVGVRALAIHPREHDLIVATHGRGVYIIDDITPLRHVDEAVLEADLTPLPTRPSVMHMPADVQEFPGSDEFVGTNPQGGAKIVYYLKRRHIFGDLKVEILDNDGNVITSLAGTNRKGINRVSWAARGKGPKMPPAASLVPQMYSFLGPQVAEGTYKIRIVKGDRVFDHEVTIVQDPRADYTTEDKALQDELVNKLYGMLGRLTYLVDALIELRTQVLDRAEKLEPADALAKMLRGFAIELETFRKTIVATRKGGFLAGEEKLRELIGSLYGNVNGFEGRPTDSQVEYTAVLDAQLTEAETRLEAMTLPRLGDINARLHEQELEPIERLTKTQWESRPDN